MNKNETFEPTEIQKPEYDKPEMKVMTDDELLVAFQVTQAGITWWVM